MESSVVPIQIDGLSVSYGRTRVLSNIYVEIEPGQVAGIVGPNGAGKSTLFKAILGLVEVNAGKVLVFGDKVESQRRRIAYIPQRDDVDWQFPATVYDIVLQGRYPHKRFLQPLHKSDHMIALEAMEKVGIDQLRNRQIGALSGGQQQRVFLARALCQESDIFLLDEPFVGVDMTTEEKIIDILKGLAIKGKTMLVVHHDLSTVENYFDYVVLLNQRLIAAGKTADAFTQENISKAYGAQLTILHKAGYLR